MYPTTKVATIQVMFYKYFIYCQLIETLSANSNNRLFGNVIVSSDKDSDVRDRGILDRIKFHLTEDNTQLTLTVTDPRVFDWIKENISTGAAESLFFEEKKREDGYRRTAPEASPHSVFLLVVSGGKDPSHICTGSLLTPRWVLTAAHCLIPEKTQTINYIIVYAGGNSMQEVINGKLAPGSQLSKTTEYYPHPNYTGPNAGYDIGVLKSSNQFNLTRTVNTVKLSLRPWGFTGYKKCTLTGFGRVLYNQTHGDDATRKTHELMMKKPCPCSAKMNTKGYLCNKPMEDFGLCVGDSGGGLVCDGRIMGVVASKALINPKTCEAVPDLKGACGSNYSLQTLTDTCFFVGWVNLYVKLYSESQIPRMCEQHDVSSGSLQTRVTNCSCSKYINVFIRVVISVFLLFTIFI